MSKRRYKFPMTISEEIPPAIVAPAIVSVITDREKYLSELQEKALEILIQKFDEQSKEIKNLQKEKEAKEKKEKEEKEKKEKEEKEKKEKELRGRYSPLISGGGFLEVFMLLWNDC